MPRLSQAEAPQQAIEFVVSVPLDLMNALYFTSLVPQIEGVDGWPVRLRDELAPDLLAELDFLYNYPAGDPGLMGTLGDNLFVHPEAWRDVDALISYIQGMPDGIGDLDQAAGIQGLIYQATFRYPDEIDHEEYERLPHREAMEKRVRSLGDRDTDGIMAWYDRPQELRERMIRLIERFYEAHYRHDLERRMACLERSVSWHRSQPMDDVNELARRLTGRAKSCLEDVCPGPYDALIFAPSLDMGPYTSCASIGRTHGLFYSCEEEFMGEAAGEPEGMRRLARIHKALSDEQRLRILHLLREGEMYAQEIVERTGLHQSAVSRHLAFMKAVGLVEARRQNNMKFFSINPSVRNEISKTLDLFAPPPTASERQVG
jgi:DNA-binding transcriptional ArsR family regulator